MRKRSSEVLIRVLENARPLSVSELAEDYGTTEKTLRNDVSEINQFLSMTGAPNLIISREGFLIKALTLDATEVEERLWSLDAYDYKLSGSERQRYISMVLLCTGCYMTMRGFAEEMQVSRVTIVNDMDSVKERMARYGVMLKLDPGKGMVIDCSEATRVCALASEFSTTKDELFFQRFICRRLEPAISLEEILSAMQRYMTSNNLLFAGEMYYSYASMLFSLFNFAQREGAVVGKEGVDSEIDAMMLSIASTLGIEITQDMIDIYQSYTCREKESLFVKPIDNLVLYRAIARFVDAIDQELHLGLVNDSLLLDALLLHISNMQYWEKFDIELPAQDESSINYALLEALVEDCAPILERYLGYQLNESIKRSVVIHICVAIVRSRRYLTPISALIVCPGSKAIASYLEAQIRSYFDFHIVGVLAKEYEVSLIDERMLDVDLILTTVPLSLELPQVLQIGSCLDFGDLDCIQRAIFARQSPQKDSLVGKEYMLRSTIYHIFDDQRLAQLLATGMSEIIESYVGNGKTGPCEVLLRKLSIERVRVCDEELSWEDAIRVSAQPLLAEGIIEARYVERCIEVVKEYGDYIVVSEGIALAHAGKKDGVNDDGLSLLASRRGIRFAETEQPVHLLFCFASLEGSDELEILKAIIRIGQTPGMAKRIANIPTTADIYRAIVY